MAQIMDGRALASKIREGLKQEVKMLQQENIFPRLAVIMIGGNPASKIYVRNKSKACDEIGIEYEEYLLEDTITNDNLLDLIEKLNLKKDVHGILLQSPIPKQLDIIKAFETIAPDKDVDGFNPINVGKLNIGQDCFISCTPHGIIRMLEEYNIPLEGKEAVIIGRSNLVGKPLIQCLLAKNATVTVCHSKTQHLAQITKRADIVVAALGKAKFITADMIKEGATVIDVGINRTEEGKLVGDVDFEEVKQKASYITPVPGGVGPMTIAMLMENVVKAAKKQSKK